VKSVKSGSEVVGGRCTLGVFVVFYSSVIELNMVR